MTANPNFDFPQLIDLALSSEDDRFTGPQSPERGGRTYGGQFLAQAVAAAYRTVDDVRHIHSLHSLFLRAGDVDLATEWQVDRIRDGRSFAARQVSGFQSEKEVFRIMASFHTPESGFEYQPALDYDLAALPRPQEVSTTYIDFCAAHPDLDDSDWFGQDRPLDIRYINPPDPTGGPPELSPQLTWIRMVGDIPDDPAVHYAGLAYLADGTLIDHVLLPHGYRWHDARVTGASLDHAMWFRRRPQVDQWLLYDQRVESTGGARGLATGRFYTGDGDLVATCTQEGLMRWSERS